MSVSIRWGFLPKEVRDAARPHILNYLWVLPSWVHLLHVQYSLTDEGDTGTLASMNSAPSYRFATLTIFGRWLNESPERRERHILHELIHPTNAPLIVATHELVKVVVETDSPTYKIGMESVRAASEGATVDWERALFGLHRPPPQYTEEEDEQALSLDVLEKKGQITSDQ